MWNYGWGPMHGFSSFGIFGFVFMILFWILIISLILGLTRSGFGHHDHNGRRGEKTPLDILKERYAKGEINKEEFEQKKKDLAS